MFIHTMNHFKISAYKILLLLSLCFAPTFTWSQETGAGPQEVDETTLQKKDQNGNPIYTPLVFDPVLIEYVESSQVDNDDVILYNTIETSTLTSTSTSNMAPLESLDTTPVNLGQLDSSLTQLQENISEFMLEGGVYDYRLSELYLSVGNTHQQLDEPQLAIEAFNEALQLSKINDGLFTEDQLPIVEKLVESYLSLGDIPSANLKQRYLLFIKQKIYGEAHPIILAELLKYADWNLHATSLSLGYLPNLQSLYFRKGFFNGNILTPLPGEQIKNLLANAACAYSQAIVLQHYLDARINEPLFSTESTNVDCILSGRTVTPGDVVTQHYLDTRINKPISSAESIALKNSLNFSEVDFDIPDTLQKLAYTYFLQNKFRSLQLQRLSNIGFSERSDPFQNSQQANRVAFSGRPIDYFRNSTQDGRQALERRYEYLQNSGSAVLNIINAQLDIADWYLYFKSWNNAEKIYVQVFNLMENNGITYIPGLAYPDLPTYIPSFLSPPYSRGSSNLTPEENLEYKGYIDINFTLTREARPKPSSIRTIYSSYGTTAGTERALTRRLRASTYRRQLENQTEYSKNTYSLRYYYTTQILD